MSDGLNIVVLVKQVPDTSSKAGVNEDGTVDRARAKRMLNPFDKYALQKALEAKRAYGGHVTAITMGPPLAVEVLVEALEYGADAGLHLSDRRLAASDTLSTAYALHKCVKHCGDVDLVFTGLQTTDGDTAQTGPQIAERLDVPQVTYCEKFEMMDGRRAKVQRIVEGGHQVLDVPLPALITVANSATPLQPKRFADVFAVKELLRNEAAVAAKIQTVDLDAINAEANRAGMTGSPTVVGKTEKIGTIGGTCTIFEGDSAGHNVEHLVAKLAEDNRGIEELVA